MDIHTLPHDIMELVASNTAEINVSHLPVHHDEPSLRMSNVGQPLRKLWYEVASGLPGEPLQSHVKVKFMYGHIIEDAILSLASQAGHEVRARQYEVEIDGVKGHIDAIIDGVLVDVKSCSTYSFKKFKNHKLAEDDPFSYIAQLSAYSQALGGIDGAFLAIDKTLGHICLDYYTKEELAEYDIRGKIQASRAVLESNEPPTPRCYSPVADGKSGNYVLATTCSYCRFKHECWSDANGGQGLRTFVYSTGPKFFTHVEKEPRVEEKG